MMIRMDDFKALLRKGKKIHTHLGVFLDDLEATMESLTKKRKASSLSSVSLLSSSSSSSSSSRPSSSSYGSSKKKKRASSSSQQELDDALRRQAENSAKAEELGKQISELLESPGTNPLKRKQVMFIDSLRSQVLEVGDFITKNVSTQARTRPKTAYHPFQGSSRRRATKKVLSNKKKPATNKKK